MAYTLKAQDIMVPELRYVDKTTTIKDAAQRLINEGIGSLIVTDQGSPIGIVTKRDIIWAVLFEKRDAEKETVEKIMSSPLITVNADDDIEVIIETMIRNNLTHLPVRSGNKLVGIITDNDLIMLLRDLLDIVKKKLSSEEK